ncbi:COG4315 family predicted lipoprotein [Arenimonas alkanexedens]
MNRLLASVLVTLFLSCLALGARATAPVKPRPPSPVDIALASPVPVWERAGILVEQGGRALYTYTPDVAGESRCDAKCEALWPPHYAEPGAEPHGPFTIARSSDGRPVWAWQGKPLYRWISDRKRGAAGGDGVADVWHLVRVPAERKAEVTRYFPMPTPRPGTSNRSSSHSQLPRLR